MSMTTMITMMIEGRRFGWREESIEIEEGDRLMRFTVFIPIDI